ncbi:glycosyltransferase family 2 protein [Roseobacter sp. S98]|uniref:glycosyltransferase family 2 protein n=1 Tax=Roseobacter algicola (ex Choi et al. 2025) (nom. illeg.) TaxID=3092138 RepID=UPI0035C70A21
MPRFSVILPFHNSAETLPATLASLIAQSFTNWEAICVDDASTDESAEIIARHAAADSRFRLVQNTGAGPSDARNYGASLARGDYLSFCDADDLWTPDRLSDLDRTFAAGAAEALYGRIAFFTDAPAPGATQSAVRDQPLTVLDLLGENPVCTLSNLTLQKAAFHSAGGFDRRMVHNEDLEFLIRFAGLGYRIDAVDRLHVWYRTNPSGLSSNLDAMRAGREQAIACARRFGFEPTPAQNAIYLRYLARRALRVSAGRFEALQFTRAGLSCDASAFLHPLRRGGMTTLAALAAPVLPRSLRQTLFSS